MITIKHIISAVFAIASTTAFANPVIVFTKTNGEKVAAEAPESSTCGSRLQYISQMDHSRVSIPLSEIVSIDYDDKPNLTIRTTNDYVTTTLDMGVHLSFLLSDGKCAGQLDNKNITLFEFSINQGKLTKADSYKGADLTLLNSYRNVRRMDIFPNRSAYEKKQKEEREAEEREAKKRQARESEERAYAAQYRKKLSVGDETHCGMVIERKDPIIKIQSVAGEKWLKLSQIYPPGFRGCRFINGQYAE